MRRRKKTLRRAHLSVLLPVFLALAGLLGCLFAGLLETRRLARKYTEDTVALYVTQLNKDIFRISNELILMVSDDENIRQLPGSMKSTEGRHYALLRKITEKNRQMQSRYEEVQNFFTYAVEPDVMLLDAGTVFEESVVKGFHHDLREFCRSAAQKDSVTTMTELIELEGKLYIVVWYARNGKVEGCVMQLEKVFSFLLGMMQYDAFPYIRKEDGTLIFAENPRLSEGQKKQIEVKKENETCEYQLGTLGKIGVYVLPDGGVMERVLKMQVFFVILISLLLIACMIQVIRYYYRLFVPLQQFVQGITEMEQEQQLDENGENSILELEAVSDRFRELLRKIQSLKIVIYEKELSAQRAELEYMQEQIRPHFLLNCISVIHGIADEGNDKRIIHITKTLSEYIRYNYRNFDNERNLTEELEHIGSYIDLQKQRYGEDAIGFETIMDVLPENYMIPPLVLQTLVENCVVHALCPDRMLKISLYVTEEIYEDGKYLYICVSDNGKGFSGEVLSALEKDLPISYDGRNHVGLKNIKRRLRLLYGNRGTMDIQNMDDGQGAFVEIRVPQKHRL